MTEHLTRKVKPLHKMPDGLTLSQMPRGISRHFLFGECKHAVEPHVAGKGNRAIFSCQKAYKSVCLLTFRILTKYAKSPSRTRRAWTPRTYKWPIRWVGALRQRECVIPCQAVSPGTTADASRLGSLVSAEGLLVSDTRKAGGTYRIAAFRRPLRQTANGFRPETDSAVIIDY